MPDSVFLTRVVLKNFIGCAVLEAESLERAVEIATRPPRAFPWNHILASLADRRLLSVETYSGPHNVLEIEGLHVHTSHLLHPAMTAGDRKSVV